MELSDEEDIALTDCNVDDVLLNLEKRRLKAKLEFLKSEEKKLLDIIAELKMRNLPRAEVKKALAKLKQVRREARQIRKLLKLLE
jgi:multidrug resistance efflux pump